MASRVGSVQSPPTPSKAGLPPSAVLPDKRAAKAAAPKVKGGKKAQPSALDKALSEGLAERIEVFREVGRAIEHREIPEVLDQLLDLSAVELEKVVEKLGFRVMDLRHNDGSRVTRVTADFVVQLMGGVKEGRVSSLPTTPSAVIKQIGELDDRSKGLIKRWEKANESSRKEIEEKLKAIGEEKKGLPPLIEPLSTLKRVHGAQQIGLLAQFNINNQDVRTIGTLANSTFGGGVGFSISPVDRNTGKRKFRPNANLGMHSFFGGPDFTLAEGATGPGFHQSFFGVLAGYKPLFGRYVSWQPPGKPSVYFGERYVGISLYPLDILAKFLDPGGAYKDVGSEIGEKDLKKRRTEGAVSGFLERKLQPWEQKHGGIGTSSLRRGSLGAFNKGKVSSRPIIAEGPLKGEYAKLKQLERKGDRPFDIKPSIEIGIQGDAVQHITGPILRPLFTILENVQNFIRDIRGKSSKKERYQAYSELGEMMNKVNGRMPKAVKPQPADPAESVEAKPNKELTKAPPEDWLASHELAG